MDGLTMGSELSGRRVLVVEDEVVVSFALEDMLAELGCKIVGPAARISQALAIVEAETIDLAVLDVNLNGQKSFPIADALVARGVPFVFSTEYNGDGFPDIYKKFPMMQKPYDRANLSLALISLISGATAPRN
jgi:CheY-like chemotaxis protein